MEQGQGKKLRPFTCYFCERLVENDSEQCHMAVCGHVLEPCPNKCGSYVQRTMKTRHLKECKNSLWRSMPKLQLDSNNVESYKDGCGAKNNRGDSERAHSRSSSQNSFGDHQSALIVERLRSLETICNRLSQRVENATKHQNEQQRLKSALAQHRLDVEKLAYQNQIVLEWRRGVEIQLEALKKAAAELDALRREVDAGRSENQRQLDFLKGLERELAAQKDSFLLEQLAGREASNELRAGLQEFREFYAQDNALVGAVWHEQKLKTDGLLETVSNLSKAVAEQKSRYGGLVFDVRAVTQISTEALEKAEIQEKQNADVRKELAQLKADLRGVEEMASERFLSSVQAKPGRLLWKISDFSSKMDRAKADDSILKSPVFYTHDFGYKIRVLVYLNGIKKWKGRHMLACFHVLKGEYDPLLKWPCHVEGHVILKDLEDRNNPKDISKYITAKRHSGGEEEEEPQESSSQFIFIPHATLTKPNFLKDDTVFLEIKIEQRWRTSLETNL